MQVAVGTEGHRAGQAPSRRPQRPEPDELLDPGGGEPTTTVAGRVALARRAAGERGVLANAHIPPARLAALAPIESELATEALGAWRQLVQVLTHEIMNSLTPIASLAASAPALLEAGEQEELQAALAALEAQGLAPLAVAVASLKESACLAFVNHLIEQTGAGLVVIPQTGHTVNLEEPALFNQAVQAFLDAVEHDAWATRGEVSTSLLPPDARA